MLSHTTPIRVRYADTDKMEFVYNGKYLEYFEVGRTELLRSTGLAYSQLEKAGYLLPLIEANVKYKAPAYYDDVLLVEARVDNIHTARVHIDYTIRREGDDKIIAEGYTVHLFVSAETKRSVKPPQIYIDALSKYFG